MRTPHGLMWTPPEKNNELDPSRAAGRADGGPSVLPVESPKPQGGEALKGDGKAKTLGSQESGQGESLMDSLESEPGRNGSQKTLEGAQS